MITITCAYYKTIEFIEPAKAIHEVSGKQGIVIE